MGGPGSANPPGSSFPSYPGGGVGADPRVLTPWETTTILQWTGNAPEDGNSNENGRYCEWSTPIFDLRPELGTPSAQFNPQSQGATKIYGAAGKQLLVQMTFLNPATPVVASDTFLTGLNIACWDTANPWNAQDMRPVTPEQDVTPRFTVASELRGKGPITAAQGISGVGFFAPPASALGPIRFWRWNVILRYHLQQSYDPQIVLTAGYY